MRDTLCPLSLPLCPSTFQGWYLIFGHVSTVFLTDMDTQTLARCSNNYYVHYTLWVSFLNHGNCVFKAFQASLYKVVSVTCSALWRCQDLQTTITYVIIKGKNLSVPSQVSWSRNNFPHFFSRDPSVQHGGLHFYSESWGPLLLLGLSCSRCLAERLPRVGVCN